MIAAFSVLFRSEFHWLVASPLGLNMIGSFHVLSSYEPELHWSASSGSEAGLVHPGFQFHFWGLKLKWVSSSSDCMTVQA